MKNRRAGQKVYNSKKWLRVRRAYMESKNYICERCGQPATICHHKIYLSAENLADAEIAYSFKNLECLCQACHNLEHEHFQQVGAVFSSGGNVVYARESKEILEFKAAKAAIEKISYPPPT